MAPKSRRRDRDRIPRSRGPDGVTLLQSKSDDAHPDYRRDTFESLLTASFDTVESLRLAAQERTLYHVRPR